MVHKDLRDLACRERAVLDLLARGSAIRNRNVEVAALVLRWRTLVAAGGALLGRAGAIGPGNAAGIEPGVAAVLVCDLPAIDGVARRRVGTADTVIRALAVLVVYLLQKRRQVVGGGPAVVCQQLRGVRLVDPKSTRP